MSRVMAMGAMVATAALCGAAWAQKPIAHSYTMRTTRTVDAQRSTRTARVWVKPGAGVRYDVTDGKRRAITLFVGEEAWTWTPGKGTGFHRRLSPNEVLALRRSYGSPALEVTRFKAMGGRKVGQETVRGVRCDVYRARTPDGWTHRLWVAPGTHRTRLRHESVGTSRVATQWGGQMKPHRFRSVSEFTDWQVGKAMDGGLFKPPANVRFAEAPPTLGMPEGHPLPTTP